MSAGEPQPTDDTLRQLQAALLKAVLRGEPLPGGDQPVTLPDLAFVLRQPAVFLSDENLAGPISVEGAPRPVRVLSPEELAEEARGQGDVAYLRFGSAEREGDEVRLTLEARIASGDPQRRALGLSGLQVRFRREGDRWEVAADPASFAM